MSFTPYPPDTDLKRQAFVSSFIERLKSIECGIDSDCCRFDLVQTRPLSRVFGRTVYPLRMSQECPIDKLTPLMIFSAVFTDDVLTTNQPATIHELFEQCESIPGTFSCIYVGLIVSFVSSSCGTKRHS
jgi:hypothetical protein